MTRAYLVILVAAVVAASIWTEHRAPAGLLPSPRRPYQSDGSPMDLLLLGEPHAASRGVDVEGSKRILLFTAALLTGASVAVAGLIGFVGLVVPHGVRLLLGPKHRTLLPAAAIAGAAFLIACDIAARTVRPPAEIRLGVVTALCGAPLFLIILLRRLRGDAR